MYKIGICLDCIDGKPKPLVSGRCRIHYQKYRHKVWSKKLPKKKYVHWYKKRGSQPPHERGLLIAQLDRVFSKYMRTKYLQADNKISCYTCSMRGEFSVMQLGHLFPRRHMGTRWAEEWNRIQCEDCNVFHYGRPMEFQRRMIAEVGEDEFSRGCYLTHSEKKFSTDCLSELLIIFKDKLSKLQ